MDDDDGQVDQLRMADGAVGRLSLGDLGMGLAVVKGRGAALGLKPAGQVLDRVMAFGMTITKARSRRATSNTSSSSASFSTRSS